MEEGALAHHYPSVRFEQRRLRIAPPDRCLSNIDTWRGERERRWCAKQFISGIVRSFARSKRDAFLASASCSRERFHRARVNRDVVVIPSTGRWTHHDTIAPSSAATVNKVILQPGGDRSFAILSPATLGAFKKRPATAVLFCFHSRGGKWREKFSLPTARGLQLFYSHCQIVVSQDTRVIYARQDRPSIPPRKRKKFI